MKFGAQFDIYWLRNGKIEGFELKMGFLNGAPFNNWLMRTHSISKELSIKNIYIIEDKFEENFKKSYENFNKF